MAKIKFSNWKLPVPVNFETSEGFRIEGKGWWKTSSEHGKSKGEVQCPCCNQVTDIYIWSFMGGGKRCSTCNVLLGSQGAWLSKSEFSEIEVRDFEIKEVK